MKRFLLIACFTTVTVLSETACVCLLAAKPHYQIMHIPLPKGYRIISAHYTKYGAVVGEIQNGQSTTNRPNTYGPSFAFVWRNRRLQTLRVPHNYATAEAIDASKDGKVVLGNAGLVNDGAWLWENKTGVVWRNEKPTILSPLPSMDGNTDALEFRDNGVVIGYSWTVEQPNLDFPRPESTACQWTPSDYKPTALDQSAVAPVPFKPGGIPGQDPGFWGSAANKYGVVVGALSKDNQHRAVLLKKGEPILDLNTCITHPLPHGKFLVSSEDIDARGWIIALVGEATDSNSYQAEAVLLKPTKK